MAKKNKRFADDGWAIWIDGDDTSTVYLNDWLNPKGKSCMDMAIRIRQVKVSKALHVYIPFEISTEEIEDLYKQYLPSNYPTEDVITYQWNQNREHNYRGQFNFYYTITKESISKGSMLLYMIFVFVLGMLGDAVSEAITALIAWLT